MAGNNVLVVGLKGSYNLPNLDWLPPRVTLEGRDVIFHKQPVEERHGQEVKANYDLLIKCKVGNERGMDRTPLTPTAHLNRLSKSEQYAVFQDRVPADSIFTMPPVIESPHNVVPQGDYVVVKDEYGAGGKGQAVVPTAILEPFLEHARCGSLEELRRKFPFVLFSAPYHDTEANPDSRNFFLGTAFNITPFIPNIHKEYRVSVGGRKVLLRERKLNDKAYTQAGLNTQAPDFVYDDPTLASDFQYSELRRRVADRDSWVATTRYGSPPIPVMEILELIDQLGIELGSLDLYRTTKGQWGVLEWSPEFGTTYLGPNQARDLHLEYIAQQIRKANLTGGDDTM